MTVEATDFTRQKNDVNGNPRFAVHFLNLLTDWERSQYGYGWDLSRKYEIALARSRQWGGRKYHNKKYGGGIIFQEYDGLLGSLSNAINAVLAVENAEQLYNVEEAV
jgi:hypothetical protein